MKKAMGTSRRDLNRRSYRLLFLAGLTLLLQTNANAAIVYTDIADMTLSAFNDKVTQSVDMNGDGIGDFSFYNEYYDEYYFVNLDPDCPIDICIGPKTTSGVDTQGSNRLLNRPVGPPLFIPGLSFGEMIDGSPTYDGRTYGTSTLLAAYDGAVAYDWGGWWWPGDTGYIGFEFDIGGQTHYGWGRFGVGTGPYSLTLFDFAYESDAGVGIAAGVIPPPTIVPLPGAGYLFLAATGVLGALGFRRGKL